MVYCRQRLPVISFLAKNHWLLFVAGRGTPVIHVTLARYTRYVLQVENRSEEAQVVQACLACHGSSPHTSTRDRHLEDPNVMLAGAYSGKLQLGPFLCHCCVFVSI